MFQTLTSSLISIEFIFLILYKFSSGASKTAQPLSIDCAINIIKLPNLFPSERVTTRLYLYVLKSRIFWQIWLIIFLKLRLSCIVI